SWEFAPRDANQVDTVLNLVYRQSFQEARQITFQGVQSTTSGEKWEVPTLKLANVVSHPARILINHQPGLRLSVVEMVGVSRVGEDNPAPSSPAAANRRPHAEASAPKPRSDALSFAAWRQDFTLSLITEPKARELQA